MSMNHWTDFLNDTESRQLDEIELAILRNKDELRELRKKQRKFLESGTNRMRRAVK